MSSGTVFGRRPPVSHETFLTTKLSREPPRQFFSGRSSLPRVEVTLRGARVPFVIRCVGGGLTVSRLEMSTQRAR